MTIKRKIDIRNAAGKRQAVVLVGGRGTRLGALASDTPKPLMPIDGDRAFLDYLLLQVARHGVADIILLAGHLGNQIYARYHGKSLLGAELRVVVEPEPLGTAGALLHARNRLNEQFFLLNGDGYLDCNLLALSAEPLTAGGARLALRHVSNAARYGSVRYENGFVRQFEEKSAAEREGLINGGVYWMQRSVLDGVHELPCSLEQDIFPLLAASGKLGGYLCDGYFIDIGLPDTLAQAQRQLPEVERRPAAFLDRDGTLNVDDGYSHDPADLVWIDGAVEAVRGLNDAGWYVFVCTNQAGVAHGYYDEAAVDRFHSAMQAELSRAGAHVDAFYHCPFHPNATIDAYRHDDHPDRKPNPGMLMQAMAQWPIRRDESVMVGDQPSDLAAAAAAGVRGIALKDANLAKTLADAGLPIFR
jgi:D-glycero-D-manno-heptose 1,7-bisphosphate phosphatase